MILYALLCGSLPFDDENIPNLFKKIKVRALARAQATSQLLPSSPLSRGPHSRCRHIRCQLVCPIARAGLGPHMPEPAAPRQVSTFRPG